MMENGNALLQMRWDSQSQLMLLTLLGLSLVLGFLLFLPYADYFRRFGRALRLMLAALVLGDVIMFSQFARWSGRSPQFHPTYPFGDPTKAFHLFLPFLAIVLTVIFILPLVINFLDQIVSQRGHGTGDLQTADTPPRGRPWLSSWNLFWTGGAALFAWIGFDNSLWLILLAVFTALAAWSTITAAPPASANADAPPTTSSAAPAEDLSAERARVLRLLEEGKINAEECGELLTALAESARGPAPRPVSPARKLVVAGAALVFVGFLLPWFSINMGQVAQEMQDKMMGALRNALPGGMPSNSAPGNIALKFPGTNGGTLTDGTIRIQGGDVNQAWLVLTLAIAAAALPLFAGATPPATRRKYAMAMLLAGSLILVYVVSQNVRFAAAGIGLVAAGYVLEWLGLARETPARG